jgi:hypothetical protein
VQLGDFMHDISIHNMCRGLLWITPLVSAVAGSVINRRQVSTTSNQDQYQSFLSTWANIKPSPPPTSIGGKTDPTARAN